MISIFTRLPILHRILIAIISALIVVVFSLPDVEQLRPKNANLEVGKLYSLPIKQDILNITTKPFTSFIEWETHIVGSGDSAAVIFKRAGLSSRTLHKLINTNNDIKRQLTRLRPGDKIEFGLSKQGDLLYIRRPLNAYETFVVTKKGDQYKSSWDKKEIYHQYNYAQATITSNFWNAATKAGLTANMIMELAGIYGWDIDFALDIRENDRFEILYQEKVVEGEVVGHGRIIAASFSNQGKELNAIYDDVTGSYYDESGRAMKKAFLRAPLDFRRVSSNFNPRRLHPVTGRVRAHRGTDYVAPIGTAIWAAGDGTVQKSGYNKYNGHYVFIKHSNTYITKYLHLKKRLVRTGQRVKQGQSIGTLGRSGRVTGAHLHYEFLVNGSHRNPRTVSLPQSKSLKGKAKSDFIELAKQRFNTLTRYSQLLYQPL
ncbi:peptidoglycan DD-metalloendopeptidase family protein [Vibrio sp.]|nr:peptidoglycan DD-metalloendopeptidase family protein [Vibrio sp.]